MKRIIYSIFFIILFEFFVFQSNILRAAESTWSTETWITDKDSGCKVWNPLPKPNETISYRGECKNGKAHGKGTLIWFQDGRRAGTDIGNFVEGFFIKDWNFKGHIIGLPYSGYLISFKTDKKTGTVFWMDVGHLRRFSCNSLVGVIPKDKSGEMFLMDEVARSLILTGAEFFKEACKMGRLDIILVPHDYKIEKTKYGRSKISPILVDTSVRFKGQQIEFAGHRNNVLNAHRKKLELDRKQKEKEKKIIALKKDKEKKTIDSKKIYSEFVNRSKIKSWPDKEELDINPFVYEGKVIGIVTTFEMMLSATKGIFDNGNIITSENIPKGIFRRKAKVVLAGRVLGKELIKIPIAGEVLVPKLKFVDVYFCKDKACNEMFYWIKHKLD